MNGCMLVVLLAMAAQVGAGLPTGQLPMDDNRSSTSTDYGWKINPDTRELEYIVQVSPDTANKMVQENKEFTSELHPEVAIRIRKVVVRIGSEVIESLPLSEVRRLPPVIAPIETNVQSELGKGRFAQLENGVPAELKNVSGGAPPPSLPAGGVPNLTDAVGSLSDSMAETLKNPDNLIAQNTIDSFLNGTRGAVPNSSAGSKFSNTGAPPTSTPTTPNMGAGVPGMAPLPGATNPTTPTIPLPGSLPGAGQSNPASVPAYTQTPGYNQTPGYSQTPGFNSTPGYNQSNTPPGVLSSAPSTPGYAGAPATNGNFASAPRGNATQPFPSSTPGGFSTPGNYTTTPLNPNSQYNGSAYGQNPAGSPFVQQSDPPSYWPSARVADNRGLPTTSGSAAGNMATSGYGNGTTGSASDIQSVDNRTYPGAGASRTNTQSNYGQTNMNDYQRTGVENIMPVMFVLSLVVNFYLGMLIRKLLGRYRTLLASVRSQTV